MDINWFLPYTFSLKKRKRNGEKKNLTPNTNAYEEISCYKILFPWQNLNDK